MVGEEVAITIDIEATKKAPTPAVDSQAIGK
jgi:hypothetical protein